MLRFTQCALLGAVALLAGLHLDRLDVSSARGEAPDSTVEAAVRPAPARMTTSEVRAFLTRQRVPHGHLDLRILTQRVNDAAARHQLDPAMVLAVIRVESMFRPAAISHKGALGLMQILPGTGEELAMEIGFPWEGEHVLLEPDLNIELGAFYLRKMLDRFGGDREAALEAYNVGPARLARRRAAEPEAPFNYASLVLPYWQDLR